jgi:hypothetical protein
MLNPSPSTAVALMSSALGSWQVPYGGLVGTYAMPTTPTSTCHTFNARF